MKTNEKRISLDEEAGLHEGGDLGLGVRLGDGFVFDLLHAMQVHPLLQHAEPPDGAVSDRHHSPRPCRPHHAQDSSNSGIVQGHDHPWLLSHRLSAMDLSWVAGDAPAPGSFASKARYRQPDSACILEPSIDAMAISLTFPDAQWAVTPGQSAVLYDGEVCLGGGVIESAAALA